MTFECLHIDKAGDSTCIEAVDCFDVADCGAIGDSVLTELRKYQSFVIKYQLLSLSVLLLALLFYVFLLLLVVVVVVLFSVLSKLVLSMI